MNNKRTGNTNVKETIFTHAANLFAEKGIGATSLADISAKAGISKGTLYYYYPAKELLVAEVSAMYFNRVADLFFEWINGLNRDSTEEEAVRSLFTAWNQNVKMQLLHIAICAEAAAGNAQLRDKLASCHREWSVMLELGILKIPARTSSRLRNLSGIFLLFLDGYTLKRSMGLPLPSEDELIRILLKK